LHVIPPTKFFEFSYRILLFLASKCIKGCNYCCLRLAALGSTLVILYLQLLEVEAVLVFISSVKLAYSAPLGYITTCFLANLKVDALGALYIV
jgi:hypothetical protein